jgi:hypothetical protein
MRVAFSSEMPTQVHHMPGIFPPPPDFQKVNTRIGKEAYMPNTPKI